MAQRRETAWHSASRNAPQGGTTVQGPGTVASSDGTAAAAGSPMSMSRKALALSKSASRTQPPASTSHEAPCNKGDTYRMKIRAKTG
jgi:hypothetical protein